MALDQLLGSGWFWRAFAAVGVVSLACSMLSVLVVVKRMAFIGQGISHAGFGGYAVAVFLGLSSAAAAGDPDTLRGLAEQAIIIGFCLATAWGIGAMTSRRRLEADTAIGVLLVAGMALGVLLLNLRLALQSTDWYRQWFGGSAFTVPWEQLLFGQPFMISPMQLWIALALSAAVLGLGAALFKELVFFTFDEPASRVFGVPSRAIHYLTLTMLAMTVVVGMQLVGFLLVSALLVIPGAAAMLAAKRLAGVLTCSAVVGVGGSLGGLVLAGWQGELPPGACIVALLFVIFCATAAIGAMRKA